MEKVADVNRDAGLASLPEMAALPEDLQTEITQILSAYDSFYSSVISKLSDITKQNWTATRYSSNHGVPATAVGVNHEINELRAYTAATKIFPSDVLTVEHHGGSNSQKNDIEVSIKGETEPFFAVEVKSYQAQLGQIILTSEGKPRTDSLLEDYISQISQSRLVVTPEVENFVTSAWLAKKFVNQKIAFVAVPYREKVTLFSLFDLHFLRDVSLTIQKVRLKKSGSSNVPLRDKLEVSQILAASVPSLTGVVSYDLDNLTVTLTRTHYDKMALSEKYLSDTWFLGRKSSNTADKPEHIMLTVKKLSAADLPNAHTQHVMMSLRYKPTPIKPIANP